jgi:hypothetical protein
VTAAPEYLDVVKAVIVGNRAKNAQHRAVLEEQWRAKSAQDVIDELEGAKTQYGARLPSGFGAIPDPTLRVPERIRLALDLAIPPATLQPEATAQ